ncbi:MAG: hypothetical protein INR71_08390 [Terriglobus roseus]|nr:hypothetical protein [Terriglobus roseus]
MPVDFDAYSSWRQSHAQPTTTNGISTASDAATSSDSAATAQEAAAPAAAPAAPASDAPGNPSADASDVPAPYPSSFARIVELITTGQPIPGIKQIPDTVLSGQSSRSTAAARRKPWERDAGAGAGAAGAEGVAAGSEG